MPKRGEQKRKTLDETQLRRDVGSFLLLVGMFFFPRSCLGIFFSDSLDVGPEEMKLMRCVTFSEVDDLVNGCGTRHIRDEF